MTTPATTNVRPVSGYLDRPKRKASEVALARLLAQLTDSETVMTDAIGPIGVTEYAALACREMQKIMIAKQRYDAARLGEGGDPVACGLAGEPKE